MSVVNPQTMKAAYSPSAFRVQAAVGLQGTDQADEGKYRRLTSKSERDLTPLAYLDVCKKSFYLWQRNMLARRMLEILVDFCVGEDFHVKVKTKKRTAKGDQELKDRNEGQMVWDDFFEDPQNNLEEDLTMIITDGLINGELVIPANVNETDGKVWLGYLDPRYIKDASTNPQKDTASGVIPVAGDIRKVDTINMTPPSGTEIKSFKVIRFNFDGNPKTNKYYGKLAGEVFFFQFNKLPTQLRGYSQIMDAIDWVDAFDQFLFGALDGFDARNDYFFDCELEGYTQEQIDATKVTRPDRGMVNVHNEKAKWNVIKADLAANDVSEAAKLIRDFIVGTKGYSKIWFGEGDTTNRSTAEQMNIPTKQMLTRLQKKVKGILRFMGLYALQCAQDANRIKLAPDEYFEIDISMFNLNQKDMEASGQGFASLINALAVAVSKGWARDDSAKKVVDGYLQGVGVDIDTSETVEVIKKDNQNNQQQRDATNTLKDAPPISDYLTNLRKKNGLGEFGNQQQDPASANAPA